MNEHTIARNRAEKVRADALTGRYTHKELAKLHHISVDVVRSYLYGQNCKTPNTVVIHSCKIKRDNTARKCQRLRKAGHTIKAISKELDISMTAVIRMLKMEGQPQNGL